jgi:hypothetical protein
VGRFVYLSQLPQRVLLRVPLGQAPEKRLGLRPSIWVRAEVDSRRQACGLVTSGPDRSPQLAALA